MKTKITLVIGLVGLSLICLGFKQPHILKTDWMSDAVYYATNRVADVEANARQKQPAILFFQKEQITTNKVAPLYFIFGNGVRVELGAREDGVIVWREVK